LKHRYRAYRAGRCAHWIKVKYPASPAMLRAEEGRGDEQRPRLICLNAPSGKIANGDLDIAERS